jgi:hypothetical protein
VKLISQFGQRRQPSIPETFLHPPTSFSTKTKFKSNEKNATKMTLKQPKPVVGILRTAQRVGVGVGVDPMSQNCNQQNFKMIIFHSRDFFYMSSFLKMISDFQ